MNLDWMLIRGTGLVAYVLLAASTIWGLMLSSKVFGRLVKAKPLTWLHEGLAVGSLLATGAHMFFLWTDEFIEFGAREIFLPGASTWEPLSVAFGVMAFYVMVIVSASFYVKRWIGQAAWRAIHFLAFGTFAAAAIHGIMAGTDTQHPVVLGVYIATVALVVMLLLVRISQEVVTEPVAAASPARTSPARTANTEPAASDHAVAPTAAAGAPAMEDRLAALRARRSPPSNAATSETLDRIAALQARRARAGND
jgi:DMSO/TMAO reductase YedYZ heme-binding membrane subunit